MSNGLKYINNIWLNQLGAHGPIFILLNSVYYFMDILNFYFNCNINIMQVNFIGKHK